MIKVTVCKNEDGVYREFSLFGHAGYDDSGQDIVCAAVSVLYLNTVNAIETFTKDVFYTKEDPRTGAQILQLGSSLSEGSKLLLDTMLLGFETIREEYGKKYIKIIYK